MRYLALSLTVLGLPLLLAGCADHVVVETHSQPPPAQVTRVYVSQPPPPPPVHERRWARPDAQHVWVPGHHVWTGDHYVWSPGYYTWAPRPHAVYHSGHWSRQGSGYVFIQGHF